MIRHRWLLLTIVCQLVAIVSIVNRVDGNDRYIALLLLGSVALSTRGLARLERWNWDD